MGKTRLCLIGAGPSGMSFLYNLEVARKEGKDVPDVVCFDRQSNWGGLWNYTWRTGLDQNGEPVHGSMYRYLWSNGPKEALEFPDYTFEEHYGQTIPSFPPREVLFDYLQGRWKKFDLERFITFNHSVKNVTYDANTDKFSVVTKNHKADVLNKPEEFDYVVNCSGHFSTPNVPSFPGIEKFPGRVLHAHDFRDAVEFKDKRLLIVGASYSAEDIALQCIKYGAKSIICSYRTKPMGFKWPSTISERPLVTKIEGNTVHFVDGSSAEVDAILLATGYLHHYPHLEDQLRLTGPNVLFPKELYKGIVWTRSGNGKFLYIGAPDEYYTFTMFDMQALWALKYIMGEVKRPDRDQMQADMDKWLELQAKNKDYHDEIDYQTAYVLDLAAETKYPFNLDVAQMFHDWEHDKDRDILTYRDKAFASKFTGNMSPIHHTPFMQAMDDSLECFLGSKFISGKGFIDWALDKNLRVKTPRSNVHVVGQEPLYVRTNFKNTHWVRSLY